MSVALRNGFSVKRLRRVWAVRNGASRPRVGNDIPKTAEGLSLAILAMSIAASSLSAFVRRYIAPRAALIIGVIHLFRLWFFSFVY